MRKFTFEVKPTFQKKVIIPVTGDDPREMTVTFKYKTRSEMDALFANITNMDDVSVLMELMSGWDADMRFDRGAVEKLHDTFMGAAGAIIQAYTREMYGIPETGTPGLVEKN